MMKKIILFFVVVLGLTASAQEAVDSTAKCWGAFSVAPNVKVRFAPGNLQYQPSSHRYRFAEKQTEVLGWDSRFAGERYKGWLDLFGWGTGSNPVNFSDKVADYPNFIDWGLFCGLPTNGGLAWRTLSVDEWAYLLSKRPHARRLYAVAYVEGVYGLILLPDDWKTPKGLYVKTGPKEEDANYYNAERWAKLEAAGAVFLPAEVKRVGTAASGSASQCHYWTATLNAKKSSEAVYILLDPFVPQTRAAAKYMGLSVRLVQTYFVNSEQ